jgi:tetratricopeptide (TPR) repeat protein
VKRPQWAKDQEAEAFLREAEAEREDLLESEAWGFVESLFRKQLSKAQVMHEVRANRILSEPVRQRALAFVEEYWKALVHRRAFQSVLSLFAEQTPKPKVIESLRKDDVLSEEVRQEAVTLAEHWPVERTYLQAHIHAEALNLASWAVVVKPGGTETSYHEALHRAERACRLAPKNGSILNTHGVAQYRVGKYQQAIESLSRSKELNAALYKEPIPVDLAFLAMAHSRLGQKQKAQEYFNSLLETMKKPRWANDEESQALLREADTLLRTPAEESSETRARTR